MLENTWTWICNNHRIFFTSCPHYYAQGNWEKSMVALNNCILHFFGYEFWWSKYRQKFFTHCIQRVFLHRNVPGSAGKILISRNSIFTPTSFHTKNFDHLEKNNKWSMFTFKRKENDRLFYDNDTNWKLFWKIIRKHSPSILIQRFTSSSHN